MKAKILLSLTLAFMLVVFSACGGSKPAAPATPAASEAVSSESAPSSESSAAPEASEAEIDITVEEIYEANNLMNLLDKYGSVSYVQRVFLDLDEKVDSETKGQYILHDGLLWFDSETNDILGDRSLVCGYKNTDVPGTISVVSESEGETSKYLHMMPEATYQDNVSMYWMPIAEWDSCEIDLVEKADGGQIDDFKLSKPGHFVDVVCRMDNETFSYTIRFYIEEEFGHVLYWEETFYDAGEPVSFAQTFVTYSEPYITEAEGWGIISGGEDRCELTVVFNPGKDNEEIQTVNLAKDVSVRLSLGNVEEMYSDAECKTLIDSIDLSQDSATVYAVPTL